MECYYNKTDIKELRYHDSKKKKKKKNMEDNVASTMHFTS